MESASMRRSQAILRMPVDMVDAVMILEDGDRSDVLLYIPPSEDVARFLCGDGKPFVPVMREACTCLVARSAIAAIGVSKRRAPQPIEDLPTETQKVSIKLRGGATLEGTLTWVAPFGHQRTADHLNAESPLLVLEAGDLVYFVPKTGIVMVVEL
jgi:hypothetical protein